MDKETSDDEADAGMMRMEDDAAARRRQSGTTRRRCNDIFFFEIWMIGVKCALSCSQRENTRRIYVTHPHLPNLFTCV